MLRKAYSIGAFALVGALFTWASGASITTVVLVVAAYSALIEAGQKIVNGDEPLVWNAVDVACGAAGGWLGSRLMRLRAR